MTTVIVLVFGIVYLGMLLGGLPFLQLDRTGIALLGAMALVGVGAVSPEAAVQSLHLPTLILLFAFMVLSAQMRLGGFYAWVTWKLAALPLPPPQLLGVLIVVIAALLGSEPVRVEDDEQRIVPFPRVEVLLLTGEILQPHHS